MVPAEWLQYAPKPRPLAKDKKWHVFLSYRSINRAWVLNLYDILTELGYKVFLDQYVLKPGDSLAQALEDGLAQSEAGILIWSMAAQDSKWVRNEYEVMLGKSTEDESFRFIPIKVDRASLPVFANTKLFLDFAEYPDGPNGGDLLRLVHGIVGEPLNDEAVHFASEQDEEAGIAVVRINAAIKNGNPERLTKLFEQGGLPWRTTAALGCKVAQGLIDLGDYTKAIDVLTAVGKDFRKALRPKQLMGLALAKRAEGTDLDDAQELLGELYAANNMDPETMGIYARTWMDRSDRAQEPDKSRCLLESADLYAQAFDKSPDDYYTGINAASKSLFTGRPDYLAKSLAYAALVEGLVGAQAVPDDYWKTATVAEVLLLQKKYQEAGTMYGEAVAIARSKTDSHKSSWKQALKILTALNATDEERRQVLGAFSHLPDYLDSPSS